VTKNTKKCKAARPAGTFSSHLFGLEKFWVRGQKRVPPLTQRGKDIKDGGGKQYRKYAKKGKSQNQEE